MQLSFTQRWRRRRASYRPAGEPFDPRRYDVVALTGDAEAKAFVVEHHYSGTYPAARYRMGLFDGSGLVGIAVFSHPCSDVVLTSVFPGRASDSVELGRLVLLDQVRANAESWFVARCFELLRQHGLRGVVSFADPLPRRDGSGRLTTPGHVGTVYQATNGIYLGRSTPRTLRLLSSGATFSARAIQKIRRRERGWEYAVRQLLADGAPTLAGSVETWLAQVLRAMPTVRHPGNHKYAWALHRRERLPRGLPYPKLHFAGLPDRSARPQST